MSSLPSIPVFFNTWCRHQGDPLAVATALNLTPVEILRLSANAEFVEMTLAWQALQLAHLETLARTLRVIASKKLREAFHATSDPAERRKGATTLARIANTLIHGPTRPRRTTDRPSLVPEYPTGHGRSVSFAPANPTGEPTPSITPAPILIPDAQHPTSTSASIAPIVTPTSPSALSSPTPPSTSPPPLTRADLLRRMVQAANFPIEIPPTVSLPSDNPAASASLPARLIKCAGTLLKLDALPASAPNRQPPTPLPRTLFHIQELPRAG